MRGVVDARPVDARVTGDQGPDRDRGQIVGALTFFPATDVPVPPEYTLGPGDEVRVQLFGKRNETYSFVVTREGEINFPETGPVAVAGLSFGELRDLINERVAQQMIGVSASVTMGQVRTIRVFVLGDVERPGSYVVTGLSTMMNALFVGGVSNMRFSPGGRAWYSAHCCCSCSRFSGGSLPMLL